MNSSKLMPGMGRESTGEVIFIEKVVDSEFQLHVHRFEKEVFSKETLLMKYSGRCPVSV